MEKIKFNILKLLNLILFLSITAFAEELGKGHEYLKNLNNTGKETNIEDLMQSTFFGKKYDLFLPKYDFQRPYKFRKEQYSKIMKYASDHKRKTEVPRDVYIMGDDLIQEYEEAFKKEILYRIINKEVNLEEVVYDSNFDVYAYPDISAYREQKPKFLASEDYQMKNYDDLGNFLRFSLKKIEVVDKPICIATMVILNIVNIRRENTIIKSIRSDLFQAAIFIPKNKEMPHSYNQKNLYPRILAPEENFSLQVIILPDMVGRTVGNIYFELADNKVIVYPIEIKAVENIYKIQPIYVHNWQGSKLFISHINLYNPHPKTLIIKEVINSFSSINLIWPNGQPVSSNHTSISSSMLEVPSKSTKNILQINFYKDVPGVEYGLLQLKTDRDTLIIPVVVGVEVQVIRFFPNFYNFGVVDVNRPVKRLIPISLSNLALAPVQIKTIYSSFEENLVEFIPNLNNFFCNFDLILSGLSLNSFSFDAAGKGGVSPHNPNSFSNSICIINRIDNMNNFGFLMIDPTNYREDLNGKGLNKKTRGSIIVQTNYTDNPFIELTYEYYLDKNTLSFEKEPELNYNSYKSENGEVSVNLKALVKPPFYAAGRDLWGKNATSSDNNLAAVGHNNNINANNQLIANFESNELTSKLNNNLNNQEIRDINLSLKIKNTQSFQNKKNYFFPIKLNNNMVTLFPVKLYDKSVELHYCDSIEIYKECLAENYSAYKSINFKSQTLNIDFGLLTTSEAGKKYLNLLNDNGENIKILKVESTTPSIAIAIESIEDILSNKIIPNKFNKKYQVGRSIQIHKNNLNSNNSNNNKKTTNSNGESQNTDDIQLIIPAESYLTLSVIVSSPAEQELNGSVFLHFENNVKLTVNVNSKFLKGNLNITPSVVRFEPAFPGLFQSKLVSSKSSYNIPINILSIKSFDQRIVPVILTNSIISNNRTEILKIIFDPSKVEIEENFMRGDSFANSTSRHLTYKELYLWKEKQKLWEILGSQGRTEINTIVKIKTNIQTESVNVRGFLTKPSLVKKDEIEFGLVQLGESNTAYIEVFNPSDEPMSIQILLAPEEFADIHNNSMFFNNKQRLFPLNNITILECNYFNISNFIDQTSQNFTQNFISNKSKKRVGNSKRKGSSIEETADLNANSILLEEEIANSELNLRSISKNELLKKIFLYTNVNSKVNFLESERIICNTNFFKKNEIIFNNNKELIEKIFSEEFMKEINIIKRMTDRLPPSANRAVSRESNLNFFEKIAQGLKAFFRTEVPQRKKRQEEANLPNNPNANMQNSLLARQEFFLPKALSSQVFIIKPHQKTKIGPILYSPSNYSVNSTATLFIKNNLTVLYPIKLKGHGGSGVLNFFLINKKRNLLNANKQGSEVKETAKEKETEFLITEEKFEKLIINIDSLEEIENNNGEIVKEIKVKNSGNLPVKVNNITIKDSSCEGYGIKLSKCTGFLLKPEEHMKLSISIFPDFNFYYVEKEILFQTFHQTINIKILISISDDILAQKNKLLSLSNFKGYGLLSFGASALIVFVIAFIMKKEQLEKEAETAAEADKAEKFISFVSAKDIIEKNNLLKFENLFIKAYRKNNRAFYEEFFAKHMDAPTKHEVENLIADKRKKNLANNSNSYNYSSSKNAAVAVDNSKAKSDDSDKNKNQGSNEPSATEKNKTLEKTGSKEIAGNESEGKEVQTAKAKGGETAGQKTQQGKKGSLTGAAGAKGVGASAAQNKKNAAKKPYGIAIKGQDNAQSANQINNNLAKKEDEKKTLHNILNSAGSNVNNNLSSNNNNINNINYANANLINSQTLLPGSIYQTGGVKYISSDSNAKSNISTTPKDDLANLPPDYYANQMNPNWVDPAFYQGPAMGFWPKNYQAAGGFTNFPNAAAAANIKRFPAQPNFDVNSGFSAQGSKNPYASSFNSFTAVDNDKKSSVNINPNNPSFVSSVSSTPLNPEAPSFSIPNISNVTATSNFARRDSKEDKSKSGFEAEENLNKENEDNRNIKVDKNDINANATNTATSFANNFKNLDFTGAAGEAPSKSSGIPNIKEQFMSFVPGFFTQDAYNNNNNNNSKSATANFLNMNFIPAASEKEPLSASKNANENDDLDINQINRIAQNNLISSADGAAASQANATSGNLIGNFKMIDFTNYFNNQGSTEEAAESGLNTFNNFDSNKINNFKDNNINTNNLISLRDEENSDNEDLNNLKDNDNESGFNENEYEYAKYRSDREKVREDSGAEERDTDIKFNFNSIFGQNNMKLIGNPGYGENDFGIQENEEPKQNFDGNKPYFDKNLFFSFDSVFNNGSKATSSFFNNSATNLFSANTKSTNLLSELRDDDHEENNNNGQKPGDRWEPGHHNRLDDVAEIEDDEDDEEDPEWNTEDMDVKKEGFFDASGNYKLKQMDFNFNLDFNARK